MYKAIIVDDEPLARNVIKEYLKTHSDIEVLEECNDGFEGLKAVQKHNPNLIFLDVQMPKISGFEFIELLDAVPNIVFTTAFDEYAIKAFEANAIDYLLKPFSKERFDKAIQRFKDRSKELVNTPWNSETQIPIANDRVLVKVDQQIKIIPSSDITYIEASGDYVKICLDNENYLKNKTMQYFENFLNKTKFVRIHRSYIVNVEKITRIDLYEKDSHIAVLKSGLMLPISRTGYTSLKEVLGL